SFILRKGFSFNNFYFQLRKQYLLLFIPFINYCMKKFFLSFIFLFMLSAAFACPICGCGVGGFYICLLSVNQTSFIGLRYQYSHYDTRLADEPDQFSKDYYHVVEVWGGITLGQKWQLLG